MVRISHAVSDKTDDLYVSMVIEDSPEQFDISRHKPFNKKINEKRIASTHQKKLFENS